MLIFVGIPTSIDVGILFPEYADPLEGIYNVMIFYYGFDETLFISPF
jgi:hypothetical protein